MRPRPLAELSGGVRKVPRLYRANEIPFLWVRKPQSPALSRVLRTKLDKRQARITLFQSLVEESLDEAEEEDAWDREMRALAVREGRYWHEDDGRRDCYSESVQIGIEYLKDKLEEERDDLIARGRALFEIVEGETALAEKEEAERQARAT